MEDSVFSPAFGNRPSQLVGRRDMISKLLDGLSSRPGSKERATVVLGQRGMGKTVLLWELAERARKRGIVVASPTVVSQAMPDRIIEKLQVDGERLLKGGRKVTGGSLGAFGFSAGLQFDPGTAEGKSFGYKLLDLAERLGGQGRGMLILVDELRANSEELKQLLIAYTELVGERQDASIVLAGLPASVSTVLNDHVLTFLNRANKVELGPLAIGDVDAFYAEAFGGLGLTVRPELRREASLATQGSPYMLQLLGHNLVQYSGHAGEITDGVLQDALHASRRTFEEDICQTTLLALSDRDVDFLEAMAGDDAASSMADIARRLGVTDDYAQKYRRRLLGAGIISRERRGYVRFAVPYLADYLRGRD